MADSVLQAAGSMHICVAEAGRRFQVSALTRFLGDSPLRVVLKLLVVSFVVGIVMATFSWSPWDVWYAVRDAVRQVWEMGFSAIDRFVGYLLLGAVVVVPVFLLARLVNYRR